MKSNKIQTPSGQPLPEQRGDHLQYLLTAYLFENISAAGKQEVEAHLASCAECRAELAALQATLGQVQEALEPESADTTPYSFEARRLERVLQAAKRRRTRWDWLRERRGLWSLAAAAAMVVGLGGLMLPTLLTARRGASRPGIGLHNVTGSAARLDEDFADGFPGDDGVTNTAATYASASRVEFALVPDGTHAVNVRASTTVATSAPAAPPAAAEPPAAAGEIGKDLLAAVPQDQPAGRDANQAREGYTLRARGTESSGKRAEPSEPASTFDDKDRVLAEADSGPPNNPGALGGAGLTNRAPTAPAALPQDTFFGGIKPGVTVENLAAKEAPAPAQSAAGPGGGPSTRELRLGGAQQRAGARVSVPLTLSTTDQVQGLVASFEWTVGGSAPAQAQPARPAAGAPGKTPIKNLVSVESEGEPAKPAAEVTRMFAASNRRQDAPGAPPATEGDTRRFYKSRGEREEVAAEIPQGTSLEHVANLGTEFVEVNAGLDSLPELQKQETVLEGRAKAEKPERVPRHEQSLKEAGEGTVGRLLAYTSQDGAAQPSPTSDTAQPREKLKKLADANGRASGVEATEVDGLAAGMVLGDLDSDGAVDKIITSGKAVATAKANQPGDDRKTAGKEAKPAPSPTTFALGFDAKSTADFEWGSALQGEIIKHKLDLGVVKQGSPIDSSANSLFRSNQRQPRDGLQAGGIVLSFTEPVTLPLTGTATVLDKFGRPAMVTAAPEPALEQDKAFEFPNDADWQLAKDRLSDEAQASKQLGAAPDGEEARAAGGTEGWSISIPAEAARAATLALDTRTLFESSFGLTGIEQAENAGAGPNVGFQAAPGGGGGGALLGRFGNPANLAANAERQLRAYHYYRELDPALSPQVFFKQTLAVPPPAVGDEGLGETGFRGRYGVNPFVDTSRDHFSTFGMDVDTASYTLARANLLAGKLPDPKTVRVEEFINYFRESIEADLGAVFTVRCEGGPAPFGAGVELLKISIKARELLPNERKNAVLTFAVDTSGSMNLDSRLAYVRGALETLLASLQPADRVAIVAFGATPYLVLPHTAARDKDRLLAAVRSLVPSGGTNVEAGLDLAYRIADEVFDHKGVNRVILCSDGVANVGARGPDEILRKVEVFAKRGLYLSALGVGLGKYNDSMLETIANKGNGNYAYVDSSESATEVFRNCLPSTLQVLAQDAKIQVDFNPEVVGHYRLLGYENRDIADKDFRNDKVDAGEVGPGSTVTALYEIHRKPSSSGDLGKIFLRYRDTGTGRVDEVNFPLPPGVIATSVQTTSDQFRFIACAAETAELLRGSYWARNGSFGAVLDMLETLSPETKNQNEWQDLNTVVRAAQTLSLPQLSRIKRGNS